MLSRLLLNPQYWCKPHSSSRPFKVGKELRYIGAVGTGFTEVRIQKIMRLVTIARKSPFAYTHDPNKATRFRKKSSDVIYWVQPKVKCIVRYQEITNDGR